MKLNQNSITTRLYKWFYGTEELPQSLCPYFWKVTLMLSLIIPYSIITLPIIIMAKFDDESRNASFGEKLGVSLILWGCVLIILLLLSPSLLIWVDLPADKKLDRIIHTIIRVGIITWGIFIIASIVCGIGWLIENRRKFFKEIRYEYKNIYDEEGYWQSMVKTGRRYYNVNGEKVFIEEKKYILIEFIKAKYNRYCPKIDWINESEFQTSGTFLLDKAIQGITNTKINMISGTSQIQPKQIAQINERIKKEMEPIVKDFEQKEFESWLQANKNLKK
jgi:hypothetical protein